MILRKGESLPSARVCRQFSIFLKMTEMRKLDDGGEDSDPLAWQVKFIRLFLFFFFLFLLLLLYSECCFLIFLLLNVLFFHRLSFLI